MGATTIDPDGSKQETSGAGPWGFDGGSAVDPWDIEGGGGSTRSLVGSTDER